MSQSCSGARVRRRLRIRAFLLLRLTLPFSFLVNPAPIRERSLIYFGLIADGVVVVAAAAIEQNNPA